ncbi:MAG TPA: DNA repair protein RadA [Tepidisphaeraceae bacterium]|jgi:DNA repair protein RadA/Sms|nr:DNA repair protein RadA [Tepidisphaeraceae bacterium]
MAKARVHFLCNNCGAVQAKWMGKCPDCGTWDSLEEYKEPTFDARAERSGKLAAEMEGGVGAAEPMVIGEIEEVDAPRLKSGIGEFDRILGGGIVAGSAILVGGEPGIGKSTLLLQVADAIAGRIQNPEFRTQRKEQKSGGVLYVTSEESARQTAIRAVRLGAGAKNLLVLAETNVERIINQIRKHRPAVVVVDSIQMIYKPQLPAAPGSVTQLRDCCMELVYLAKVLGVAIFFVGHVTKAGTLAGPKIIEHIVDTVVYFEGDRFHTHRVVRCVKNRFGSTHEVGLFEMTGEGLREVADPGKLFVEQYGSAGPPSGSVVTAAMQGSRVLLVEVQALTASSVIGAAKRKVSGVSSDRVAMIIAVLEKRAEMRLAADDVFVNVAGGVKVAEPAIDLAIALAIASSHMNRPLAAGTLAVGELGLGGEVRSVPQLENRLQEAARLGCSQAIVPHVGGAVPKLGGMALHEVKRLAQAMGAM